MSQKKFRRLAGCGIKYVSDIQTEMLIYQSKVNNLDEKILFGKIPSLT